MSTPHPPPAYPSLDIVNDAPLVTVTAELLAHDRDAALQYAQEWNLSYAKALGRLVHLGLTHLVECTAE